MLTGKWRLAAIIILAQITFFSSAAVIQKRDVSIQATDPFDPTWIQTYTAFGDSYSNGHYIGSPLEPDKVPKNTTLNPKSPPFCKQWPAGYPNLLHDTSNLGDNPARQLRYFACAGATIKDITDSQVPLVKEADIDLATVTAGGNNINFAGILNSCIFQWQFWGNPKQCDEILNDSMDLVNSAQFSSDLDDMLRAIKTTTSQACDKVTWSWWWNVGNRQYLKQSRRTAMNGLIEAVNNKISAAVDRAGGQFSLVPVQDAWDAIKGRFCEDGVDENDAADREQTALYEYATVKDDAEYPRSQAVPLGWSFNFPANWNASSENQTMDGQIANYVKLGMADNPNGYNKDAPPIAITFADDGSILNANAGLMRSFHPTVYGHAIYARLAMDALAQWQGKIMKQPVTTTTYLETPNPAAATAPPSSNDVSSVTTNSPVVSTTSSKDVSTATTKMSVLPTTSSKPYGSVITDWPGIPTSINTATLSWGSNLVFSIGPTSKT